MSIIPHTVITIKYTTQDGREGTATIDVTNFFDLEDIDHIDGQASIFDLVWQKQHASDYLQMPVRTLSATVLEVRCATTGDRIVDIEQFWSDGTYRTLLRREERNCRDASWLHIVEIGTPEGIHFIRFGSESHAESKLLEHHLVLPDERVLVLFPPPDTRPGLRSLIRSARHRKYTGSVERQLILSAHTPPSSAKNTTSSWASSMWRSKRKSISNPSRTGARGPFLASCSLRRGRSSIARSQNSRSRPRSIRRSSSRSLSRRIAVRVMSPPSASAGGTVPSRATRSAVHTPPRQVDRLSW